MFHERDPNSPAAPAVQVPSLNAAPKTNCFTSTLFRAPMTRAATHTATPIPASSSSLCAPQQQERHAVECGEDRLGTKDCLLSDEDFVDELVREVRLTCQRAQHEQVFLAEADHPALRQPCSQQSKPVFVCPNDERDEANAMQSNLNSVPRYIDISAESRTQRSRSSSPSHRYGASSPPTQQPPYRASACVDTHTPFWRGTTSDDQSRPSRARTPSPPSPHVLAPLLDADCVLTRAALPRVVAERVEASPSTVALAASSRASSPDPRMPHSGAYSPGSAASRSLRRNRSPGVPREVSPDLAIVLDADEKDYDELSDDTDCADADGGESSHAGSRCGRAHPQWTPRAVSAPRPAWNQRQPPSRTRPIVSAPGSAPTRERGHDEVFSGRQNSTGEKDTTNTTTAAAARAMPSSPGESSPRHRPVLSAPASGTTPAMPTRTSADMQGRSSSADRNKKKTRDYQRSTSSFSNKQMPSPRDMAPTRALFPAPAPTAIATTRVASSPSPSSPLTLDAVMARAVHAEERSAALETELRDMARRYDGAMEAWSARCMALSQQVQFILEWAQQQPQPPRIDGEVLDRTPPAAHTYRGTPEHILALNVAAVQARRVPSPYEGMMSEATPTFSMPRKSDAVGATDADEVMSASPDEKECQGATPTPVRRPGQAAGEQSARHVRVPPSPPLVLQMQSVTPS